ncbi:2TM domain-containing protein [Tenacibaculum soleae]|uniref:2TM domain-containing protein n=1 Tax=Tenacibaculum soleae TaxID=447689 RepID=UPI0026E2AADF|nr:2TM domain-containing protein [Tenacibaculum soleae]MDO6743828.1 2TM domain-containing protein [Tenacibaculum soleae]
MERVKNQSEKYLKAQKRVEDIKSFYKHLAVYVLVNLFFIGRRIYKDIQFGDSITEALTEASNYKLFFIWGLFLIFHAISTFGIVNLLGKNWEERKIKEYMEKN